MNRMRRAESCVLTDASTSWEQARSQQARGFTLTELLIVMMIITILMTLLVPVISKVRNAAYTASTQQQIDRIANGIIQYYNDGKLSGSAYPGIFKHDDLGTAAIPAIPTSSKILINNGGASATPILAQPSGDSSQPLQGPPPPDMNGSPNNP